MEMYWLVKDLGFRFDWSLVFVSLILLVHEASEKESLSH
jgi:hypothetical protein